MVEVYQTIINEIKQYAEENNVPIIQDEGILFLSNYIKENNVKKILEIGTAIGYSAILMALIDKDITITTVERDEIRYLEAVKNIKKLNLENRITIIFDDAENIQLEETFDLIFLDAAKAQNKKFFLLFEKYLKSKGTIITDNIQFHGLVNKEEEIKSKNLRALVRKIKNYVEFLKENTEYITEFYELGDGISVSKRKK